MFGFAVSQCALQLPTVDGHVDLGRPQGLVFYFLTFALLASFWLTYHRLMSGAFDPTRVDLPLAFTYLALVSLMPFADYLLTHSNDSLRRALAAIAEYSILFSALMGIAAVISLRNLRRGWWFLDEAGRARAWIAFTRRTLLSLMMSIAFVADLTVGLIASETAFFAIVAVMIFVRIRVKKAPTAHFLRIAAR